MTCLCPFHEETWISRAASNLRLSFRASCSLLGAAGYGCSPRQREGDDGAGSAALHLQGSSAREATPLQQGKPTTSQQGTESPPPAPGSILRGGTRNDGSVHWDSPACCKKNFLVQQAAERATDTGKSRRRGEIRQHRTGPIRTTGTTAAAIATGPTAPTTGANTNNTSRSWKKLAQELGDQELPTSSEDKLRQAQMAKAMSRP